MDDRVFLVPKHDGYNILPCTPLFNRLLRFAGRSPARVAIRDTRADCQRTHIELLTDVLAFRAVIRDALDSTTLTALERGDEVYLAILAAGGYEYAVAMLAVLALGAAAVPSRARVVLASTTEVEKGGQLMARITKSSNPEFKCIPIGSSTFTPAMSWSDIFMSSDRYLDENAPSVVIFTSGTTGPPKGSVMRRAYVSDCAMEVADFYGVKEDDVLLHVLPVHHATGVGINFFPFLISGSCIEFRSGGFDEHWMWKRWKEGALNPDRRLTFFSGVPTIYMRMRRHFQRSLSRLPTAELNAYIAGARQFRACLCGTSALPHPLNQFWTEIMQKKIVQRYGATEFGAVFKVRLDDADAPDGSVGEKASGIELKLSEGDEGEVLIKNPYMFSKYLFDREATAKAHDRDGFFRSGDIARREGRYYWIIGRASLDIIKSGGYKISALDIERELYALPYISEAMVVGVADEEFGERVAALISLQDEELNDTFQESHSDGKHLLTIKDLRRDLRERLAGYKLPTLLRVINGEFPKAMTGKVQKMVLGPQFFPPDYKACPEVQCWDASAAGGTILAKL
ncbi:fatty-acyl-CoA synthase [Glonium stellatum]|uniref:Fatty-acyl-CoA synthase n=1 Tax=Glonium stellatum TaxID=574774 RepID=A0A8E2FAQ3_9PEZI|nr:fatty-acyl-CoA synthase [Glonium stellatum]